MKESSGQQAYRDESSIHKYGRGENREVLEERRVRSSFIADCMLAKKDWEGDLAGLLGKHRDYHEFEICPTVMAMRTVRCCLEKSLFKL